MRAVQSTNNPPQRGSLTKAAWGVDPGLGWDVERVSQESGLADKADNGPRDKSDEAS